MNVPDQFQEIGFLFAEYGFVAVLEHMAGSLVAFVERNGIPGEKTSHAVCKGDAAGPQEKMDVVREEGKGIAGNVSLGQYPAGAVEESVTVCIIAKERTALNASDHHMLYCTRGIDTRTTWHGEILATADRIVKTI